MSPVEGDATMPRAGSVVIDCDSTLSAIEGIDVLAAAHRAEVASLTDAAMRGEVALEEVYGRRLALVRPTRDEVAALGHRYVEALVPDAREALEALKAEGIQVRIISGGLRPAVLMLAAALGVGADDVAAVDVYFNDRGDYAGFDSSSPLTRSGGKRTVLEAWAPGLARPIVLVGDGATDLEARPPADVFIAFAGVVERPNVIAAADVVVRALSLAPVVTLAMNGEPPGDPAARRVAERGRLLMTTTHRA